MQNALYLKNSLLGENSQTNAVLEALLATWRAKYPQATHVVRDLAANPLPHLQGAHLAQAPDEGKEALAQLKAADALVIAAPMYNFGIPASLKDWIDHVFKAGETFAYGAEGPKGLLSGKRAVIIVGSGGVYSEGPAQAADFVVPYLKFALGFIGITDVEVIRVEGVALGEPGQRSKAAALEKAQAA
jgi:FMN-dependent NADH-azoreductase